MIRQYILIEADNMININSRYCKVAISDNEQGKKHLQQLTMYARSNGHYFKMCSADVSNFLVKVANSLSIEVYELPFISISAKQLISHIKVNGQCPSSNQVSRSTAYLLASFKPSMYLNMYYKMPKRNT